MKKGKCFTTILFMLVSCFSIFNLPAEAAIDSLITVGIYQNPPKVYFDENRNPKGIFVDLLNEIARLENWQINYVPCFWNDCLTAIQNGEIDLMLDVAINLERMEYLSFNTVPVLESWAQVYTRPDVKINQLSDLADKNVALVEGSVQQQYFHELMNGFGFQFREVRIASFPEAFSGLKIGTADAAVVNNFFGELESKTYDVVKTPVIFNFTILHFTVNKGQNTWIINAIDDYLSQWKKTPDSFYYRVLRQYEIDETENQSDSFFYILNAAILLSVCIISLLLQRKLKRRNKTLLSTNKKLRSEGKKVRGYIENTPYGVFVANENEEIIDVNSVASAMTGYSKEELTGKNILDLIPEKDKEAAISHFNSVGKEGRAVAILSSLKKNGEERFWKIVAAKISQKQFIGFVDDVTEETKLRDRVSIMDHVINQSVNEIYLFDVDTYQIIQVNEAVVNNTGYALWELKKMTMVDLNITHSADQFEKMVQPLLKKEKKVVVIETQHTRKDGTFYPAVVYLQFIETENEKVFSAVVLDISDQKNKEMELNRIREQLTIEVAEKTRELNARISDLENFREATIERELRMEELRKEIERLINKQK